MASDITKGHDVPALDLALCLGMVWRTADMFHALVIEIICQVAGDVRRTIVAEQTGLVNDNGLIATGSLQGHLKCIGYVVGLPRRAQLPGLGGALLACRAMSDDGAAVVIQDC